MLTLKKYMEVSGEEPTGAIAVRDRLQKERQRLIDEIRNHRTSTGDIDNLQKVLNDIFYGGNDVGLGEDLKGQWEANIKKRFEETAHKKLTEGFHISDLDYYVTDESLENQDFKNLLEDAQEKGKAIAEGTERKNIALGTIGKEIKVIRDVLNSLSQETKNSKSKNIEQIMNYTRKIENLLAQAEINIENYERNFTKEDPTTEREMRRLLSQFTGFKNNKKIFSMAMTLEQIYLALTTAHGRARITPNDYGMIFEIAMEELMKIFAINREKISNELISSLLRGGLAYGRAGQDIVQRGGFDLKMKVDTGKFTFSMAEKIKTTKDPITGKEVQKKIEVPVFDFDFGDGQRAKIEYHENNSILDKQGKMDFSFSYLDENNNCIISRQSLKSWGSEKDRGFGQTSLLDALIRSFGNRSILEDYSMTLQHPQIKKSTGKEYPEFQANLKAAHDLAKFAVIIDIVMGYSQTTGYANVGIINVRGQGIKIIDFNDEILKIGKNLTSKVFELKGYNEENLQAVAQNLRRLTQNRLHSGRTSNYYGLLWNYFKNVQMAVNYKASQSSAI